MSNAGKALLNWKRDFPDLRVALGLLGQAGYANTECAKFLLEHKALRGASQHSMKICGRYLSEAMVLSRLAKYGELATLSRENPVAYLGGHDLFMKLLADIRAARITRKAMR